MYMDMVQEERSNELQIEKWILQNQHSDKKFEWMGRNNNKHSKKVNTLQKYMVLIVALIYFYCRVLTMDNKDTQNGEIIDRIGVGMRFMR